MKRFVTLKIKVKLMAIQGIFLPVFAFTGLPCLLKTPLKILITPNLVIVFEKNSLNLLKN